MKIGSVLKDNIPETVLLTLRIESGENIGTLSLQGILNRLEKEPCE